jgi:hypothetical protein
VGFDACGDPARDFRPDVEEGIGADDGAVLKVLENLIAFVDEVK